tara:strand:+ start:626 stop:1060 length:435 start_codon:yes stop_codon:yes gene_type:complete
MDFIPKIQNKLQIKNYHHNNYYPPWGEGGFVYIFKNRKTKCVKVGMTGNPIADRLKAINKYNPDLEYLNGDKRLPLYVWTYVQAYQTKNYGEVEKLAHKYLNDSLDKNAPIGEVFKCSTKRAIDAVEDALIDLGLYDYAIKYVK